MKIRLKITLSMLCLLSLLFGAGGSALITLSFNSAYEQEEEAALVAYQALINTLIMVSQVNGESSYGNLNGTLEQLQNQNAFALQSFRISSGNITLYASDVLADELIHLQEAQEQSRCLFTGFEYEGKHYLHLSGVFTMQDESLYLDAAYDISPVYVIRGEQQAAFYKVLAVLVVACIVLSYLTTWLLTRPLMRLSRASKELARGNLSYRARVRTNDEIGDLAEDFNAMASQVERGVTSLRSTLEQQETFMGSFAHELKTPMTSIIGYAELIRSQRLSSEEQMDAAHFIFTEGKRLESLSFKLLDILANERGSVQMLRVSPAVLIGDFVDHLRPLYEKEQIALLYKPSGGTCMMDPVLIKSLLMNLIDNARKAIDGSGAIEIESKVSRGTCYLSVRDDGKGIPAGSLAHLTEAFFRVDRSRAREQGGVGLGLTLCAKIVEIHDGDIRFESHEGVGTCVTVILRGKAR